MLQLKILQDTTKKEKKKRPHMRQLRPGTAKYR